MLFFTDNGCYKSTLSRVLNLCKVQLHVLVWRSLTKIHCPLPFSALPRGIFIFTEKSYSNLMKCGKHIVMPL